MTSWTLPDYLKDDQRTRSAYSGETVESNVDALRKLALHLNAYRWTEPRFRDVLGLRDDAATEFSHIKKADVEALEAILARIIPGGDRPLDFLDFSNLLAFFLPPGDGDAPGAGTAVSAVGQMCTRHRQTVA